ncbi:hypothetical protein GCM10023335_85800 [Streptomyces siamensis]|uniref:Uncharacterized protein n=1 Tax=Streptomyces siamensis TaxID=1274986 RepID=A0ABP9JN37_9ACTN
MRVARGARHGVGPAAPEHRPHPGRSRSGRATPGSRSVPHGLARRGLREAEFIGGAAQRGAVQRGAANRTGSRRVTGAMYSGCSILATTECACHARSFKGFPVALS